MTFKNINKQFLLLFTTTFIFFNIKSAEIGFENMSDYEIESQAQKVFGKPPKESHISEALPFQNVISPTSLSSQGYTIDTPGRHVLSRNISFAPNSDGNIITVACNNVVIDLRECTIEQTGNEYIQNCIYISPGLQNIKIRHGTIQNINGYGVYIGNDCKNIKVKNLQINNCGKGGIFCNGTIANPVTDFEIIDTGITNCNGSSFTDSTATTGLKLKCCNNVRATKCNFNQNITDSIEQNSYGAYIETCTGCHFDFCEAVGNKGSNAAGFHVCSNSLANLFSDCLVTANVSTKTSSERCGGGGNPEPSPVGTGSGMGFGVEDSIGTIFQNCTSENNLATGNAYGFFISNSSSNEITNCIANKQQSIIENTTLPGDGSACGICIKNGSGNLIQNCKCNANTGGTHSTSKGIGILIGENETRTRIYDCETSANNGNGGTGIGIYLLNTGYGIIVIGNKVFVNTGTSMFGIKDSRNNSDALFSKNISFGHGGNNGTNNYYVKYKKANFGQIKKYLKNIGISSTNCQNINIIQVTTTSRSGRGGGDDDDDD